MAFGSSDYANLGHAAVDVVIETTAAYAVLDRLESHVTNTLLAIGASMTAAGGTITAGLIPAITAASNKAETFNAFTEVFRGANEEANKLADTLANEIGRSESSMRRLMTPIGAMVKGLGLTSSEAANFANTVASAALDISSFYNERLDGTLARLRAALSGSSEAVDQFGINLRASALKAKLAELGYESNIQKAGELEKTLARLAIIQEALARQNALGDAARTARQFANATRSASDAVLELREAVGEALLPAAQMALNVFVDVVQAMTTFAQNHPIATQALFALGIAATAAGVGLLGLVIALKAVTSVAITIATISLLTTAMRLLGIAVDSTVLGLIKFSGTAIADTLTQLPILGTGIKILTAQLTAMNARFLAAGGYLGWFGEMLKDVSILVGGGIVQFPVLGFALTSVGNAAKGAGLALNSAVVGALMSIPGWGWLVAAAITAVGAALIMLQDEVSVLNDFTKALETHLQPAWEDLGRTIREEILPEINKLLMSMEPLIEVALDLGVVLAKAFSASLVESIKGLTQVIQVLNGALKILSEFEPPEFLKKIFSAEAQSTNPILAPVVLASQTMQFMNSGNAKPAGDDKQNPEAGEAKANAGDQPQRAVSEEMAKLGQRLIEETMTPMERFKQSVMEANRALAAGVITDEVRMRKIAQAREEFERETRNLELERAQRRGEMMTESLMTPIEKYHAALSEAAEMWREGVINQETYNRALEKAAEDLEAWRENWRNDLERKAEERQREAVGDASRTASFDVRRARIDEDFGKELAARVREIARIRAAGDEETATDKDAALAFDILQRGKDLDKRVEQSKAESNFGTFSRTEARFGLGTKAVDEQLLDEQRKMGPLLEAVHDRLDEIKKELED